jgi:hypothetical protein
VTSRAQIWVTAQCGYRRAVEPLRERSPSPAGSRAQTVYERISEYFVGVLALEEGIAAARWVVANDPASAETLPITPAELAKRWRQIHGFRSDVLAHMDQWIARDRDALVVIDDGAAIEASNGHRLLIGEWRILLDRLEPWAWERLDRPIPASTTPAIRPDP